MLLDMNPPRSLLSSHIPFRRAGALICLALAACAAAPAVASARGATAISARDVACVARKAQKEATEPLDRKVVAITAKNRARAEGKTICQEVKKGFRKDEQPTPDTLAEVTEALFHPESIPRPFREAIEFRAPESKAAVPWKKLPPLPHCRRCNRYYGPVKGKHL